MRYFPIVILACALVAAPFDRALGAPAPKATPLTKAQKAKAEQLKRSAPADEYFGRMKLSYLGINNTFRDEAIRAGDHTTNDSVMNKVRFGEESLGAWRKKYPHDPQVARSLFLASRVNLKLWVADFQQRASHYMIELRDKYSTTFFGKQAKAELQKGMTMHFYAAAQPCNAAPSPSTTPTPSPSATPAPTATMTPAPNATSTPAPLPTEDQKNNIKVDVIPVPCYTPAPSPSATPAPSPSATPTPSPSATPAPTATMTPAPNATSTPAPSATPTAR